MNFKNLLTRRYVKSRRLKFFSRHRFEVPGLMMVTVLFPVQERTGALLVLFTAEDDFDDFRNHILGAGAHHRL